MTFSSPVATDVFSNFAGILNAALLQYHLLRTWNSSTGVPSPPLALFIVMLPKAHLTSPSNINNLRYADDTTFTTESEVELKNLLIKVKEESENADIKPKSYKSKIMLSVPSFIGKLVVKQSKQWQTFFSWAPKSLQMVIESMKLKDTHSLEEKLRPTWTAY